MGRQLLEEMMTQKKETIEQMKAWFVQTQQECLQQLAAARDEKLRKLCIIDSLTRSASRKIKRIQVSSSSRQKGLEVIEATKSGDGTIAGVRMKATGDHQCPDCRQKFG